MDSFGFSKVSSNEELIHRLGTTEDEPYRYWIFGVDAQIVILESNNIFT